MTLHLKDNNNKKSLKDLYDEFQSKRDIKKVEKEKKPRKPIGCYFGLHTWKSEQKGNWLTRKCMWCSVRHWLNIDGTWLKKRP